MNPQRAGKRKGDVVFELSDDDVSPEETEVENGEPVAKVLKQDSTFVESVVNALNDLESEASRTETVTAEESSAENVPVTDTHKDIVHTQSESVLEVCNNDDVSNISSQVGADEKVESTSAETDMQTDIIKNDQEITQNHNNTDREASSHESNVDLTDSTKPDEHIQIKFSDAKISELYKLKFLKFIEKFVELKVDFEDELNISVKRDSLLNAREWIVIDELKYLDEKEYSPPPLKEKVSKKKKKKTKKDKGLFVVDTNPSASEANTSIYSSKFNIDHSVEDKEESDVKAPVQTCFNCEGDHNLRDCPHPKDFQKISLLRQKFKSQRQVSRYHLEDDQKYSHLVPGKISTQLRQALGLRKKELPFYIYKMRVLGYPPGWLEEAKCVSSNLDMFDADGKNVKQIVKQKKGLDPEKIINFPGFNVPLEKNFIDEFKQHQVPPYSEKYSKEVMIEYFEKHFCNQNISIDCENDNDSNSIQVVGKTVLPDHVVESVDNDDSITELVKQKEILLEALQDSTSDDKTDTNLNDQDVSTSQSTTNDNISAPEVSESTLSISVSDTIDESNSNLLSPTLNNISSFKESSFGTPILKSSSPYSRIPKYDNFMKDVSPVINFENLPNSTGKYDQMSSVLKKVRKTMKEIPDCDT